MTAKTKETHHPPAAIRQVEFKFDPEVYREVSCAAELQEIRLVSSKFLVKPEFFIAEDDTHSPKSLFSGHTKDVMVDEQEGVIAGQYVWEAEIKFGRKIGLKLKAEYVLIYIGVAGLDPDHVSFYFNKIGRFSTYPYFRSHFSNHITEAGLMLPPLPSLNERVD